MLGCQRYEKYTRTLCPTLKNECNVKNDKNACKMFLKMCPPSQFDPVQELIDIEKKGPKIVYHLNKIWIWVMRIVFLIIALLIIVVLFHFIRKMYQ